MIRRMLWLSVVFFITVHAHAYDSAVIFDPSMSPTNQGWTYFAGVNGSSQLSAPLTETFDPDGYTMSTIGLPGISAGPVHFWGTGPGIPPNSAFVIEFTLQVHSGSYNQFDAGIGFSLAMTSAAPLGFFDQNMRRTMIFFANDRIGFGDFSSMFAVAATERNRYRLVVTESDELRVYVDDVLALTRSNFTSTGFIGFGDSTNDFGVDGDFTIGSITYTPIPEPCAAVTCWTLFLGVFPLLRRLTFRPHCVSQGAASGMESAK
jgi:hypothetical protein